MDPNALEDPKAKNNHHEKRPAVADKRERQAGDRRDRDRHPDIQKRVGKDQRHNSDSQQLAQAVLRPDRDIKAGQEQQGQRGDEQNAAKEAVLFAKDGENEVVMLDGGGQIAQFVESVGRLETFAIKAAGADRSKGLNDVPTVALRVHIGIHETGNARILIRLEREIHDQRHHCQTENYHGNEPSLGDVANKEKCEHHRHPYDAHAQIGFDQDEQPRRPNDCPASQNSQNGHDLPGRLQIHRERHDACQNSKLGRLNAHKTKIQPALGSIAPLAKQQHGHQTENTQDITRHRPKANPSVVDKGDKEEDGKGGQNPNQLRLPELLVGNHPSRAVDRVDPVTRESEHQEKQDPVHAKKLSKPGMHGCKTATLTAEPLPAVSWCIRAGDSRKWPQPEPLRRSFRGASQGRNRLCARPQPGRAR